MNHGFFLIFPALCRQTSPGARTIPTHGFTQEAVHVLQAVDLNPPKIWIPRGPWWWLVEHGGTNAQNWSQHELNHPFLGPGNCFGNWKWIFLLLMDLMVYNLDCPCSTNVFSDGKSRPLLGLAVSCETFWTIGRSHTGSHTGNLRVFIAP